MRESGGGQAFAGWMRTGRWLGGLPVQRVETKYNHWHDPKDGRFTTTGAGRHDGSWGGGGFTGGGGGGFGGGGATSTVPWGGPTKPRVRAKPKGSSTTRAGGAILARRKIAPAKPAPLVPKALSPKPYRHIVRNGYDFQIDDENRTREVTGTITIAKATRSRTSQARAGGPDRRPSDDGGHYIAAQFNGPKEAFNHFAQDANFNRGGYRALEAKWAKAAAAGAKVRVDIIPAYRGKSQRPTMIEVVYHINGKQYEKDFPNERQEKRHGKQ